MKYPSSLITRCTRAIAESMDIRAMTATARELFPGYDLYKQTGFPESIPIPNQNAAQQIISDIIDADLLLPYVGLLIDIHENGRRGRKYNIPHLRHVIKEVFELGFIYDSENAMFVEDSRIRKTRNWGVLHEGYEYTICFLRMDVEGNSSLVRKYSQNDIKKTYTDLRSIVTRIIDKRDGRIWNWEGDGGLAAFFFGNRHLNATLCAMEIMHELFMYNLEQCILEKPLRIRIAVHGGSVDYSRDLENITKSETVKRVMEIEKKFTKPGTVTISEPVKVMVDEVVTNVFEAFRDGNQNYYSYGMELE